jgi:hypothetical protein
MLVHPDALPKYHQMIPNGLMCMVMDASNGFEYTHAAVLP